MTTDDETMPHAHSNQEIVEDVDFGDFDLADVADAPEPVPSYAPNPAPPAAEDPLARARASVASMLDDISKWNEINAARAREAEARAARAQADMDALRDQLAQAQRRVAELEGLKANLRKVLEG